jgi:hypothetical protein
MAEEIVLEIIGGNLKGEEFVFDEKGLCLIGRSADCALQIPKEKDMKISRRHCLLILDPPHVRIRDLGSRNGTYVNSELLKPGILSDKPEEETPVDRVLRDKDIVEIGECVFMVRIPSAPTAEPKIPVLPQIKPQVAHSKPHIVQASPEPDPLKPAVSPNAVRPVTVTHLNPPQPTSTGTGIAVTEVMSREEIKGVSNAMQKIAYTEPPHAAGDEYGNMPHGEPVRHAPQTPLTAHPGTAVPNTQPPQESPITPDAPQHTPPQPVIVQPGTVPNKPPVPRIKQPGVVHPQHPSPTPVPVIKQPGKITNSFTPVNQKMTDPGPLAPPPPQTNETAQFPKKPTIVLTKKKAPGESAITLTPKSAAQGKPVLKAKIISKPSDSSGQKQNVVPLTPKSAGTAPTPEPAPQEHEAPAPQAQDLSLEKTPTDRMEAPGVVDKYQDTIVMDPAEMDNIPDLVSSTIPEVSNTRRVAKFKIKGLK